jgi:hypothetical protein
VSARTQAAKRGKCKARCPQRMLYSRATVVQRGVLKPLGRCTAQLHTSDEIALPTQSTTSRSFPRLDGWYELASLPPVSTVVPALRRGAGCPILGVRWERRSAVKCGQKRSDDASATT